MNVRTIVKKLPYPIEQGLKYVYGLIFWVVLIDEEKRQDESIDYWSRWLYWFTSM